MCAFIQWWRLINKFLSYWLLLLLLKACKTWRLRNLIAFINPVNTCRNSNITKNALALIKVSLQRCGEEVIQRGQIWILFRCQLLSCHLLILGLVDVLCQTAGQNHSNKWEEGHPHCWSAHQPYVPVQEIHHLVEATLQHNQRVVRFCLCEWIILITVNCIQCLSCYKTEMSGLSGTGYRNLIKTVLSLFDRYLLSLPVGQLVTQKFADSQLSQSAVWRRGWRVS